MTSLAATLAPFNVGGSPVDEGQWASVCALSSLQDLTVNSSADRFTGQHSATRGTAAISGLGSLRCLTRLRVSVSFYQ